MEYTFKANLDNVQVSSSIGRAVKDNFLKADDNTYFL